MGFNEGMVLPFFGPALAVATGQARHAVIWRTVKEGSAARKAGGRPAYGSIKPAAEGPLAWLLPVGMLSPVCQVAPFMARYMHEYGVTREQLAWIPVTQRAHAALNPNAVYTAPLSVEENFAAVTFRADSRSGLLSHGARRARLAAYKVPARWLFTDAFPRTATGKVRKDALSAQLAEAGAPATTPAARQARA